MYDSMRNALSDMQSAVDSEICGTCKWHNKDHDDWLCGNMESDNFADFTGYEDSCDCWENRM